MVKRFEFLVNCNYCTALTVVTFSENVKKQSFQNEKCYSLSGADAECRGLIVNVRCCKLYKGNTIGLKVHEYYNVSIYHDQTNGLKQISLNRYNYCVVEHE